MRKIVLTFGLISGAILAVMMSLSMAFHDQIGFNTAGLVVGYTTMVLAFLMIWFGVRTYRDDVAGGQVSFGRAFKVGFLIMAIACVCYVITWQVIYYNFMPDFMDKYAAYALEQARAGGATDAQIAAEAAEMARFKELYQNPLVNIAFTFLEPLPVGLLFTLVTAGVQSRKRKEEVVAPA
jgi:amino acid transporter